MTQDGDFLHGCELRVAVLLQGKRQICPALNKLKQLGVHWLLQHHFESFRQLMPAHPSMSKNLAQ